MTISIMAISCGSQQQDSSELNSLWDPCQSVSLENKDADRLAACNSYTKSQKQDFPKQPDLELEGLIPVNVAEDQFGERLTFQLIGPTKIYRSEKTTLMTGFTATTMSIKTSDGLVFCSDTVELLSDSFETALCDEDGNYKTAVTLNVL